MELNKWKVKWSERRWCCAALVSFHITQHSVIKEMKFLYEGGKAGGQQPPISLHKSNKSKTFLFFVSREAEEIKDIITVIRLILSITKTIAEFMNQLLKGIDEINRPQPISNTFFSFLSALWEWAERRKEVCCGQWGSSRIENEWNSWTMKAGCWKNGINWI